MPRAVPTRGVHDPIELKQDLHAKAPIARISAPHCRTSVAKKPLRGRPDTEKHLREAAGTSDVDLPTSVLRFGLIIPWCRHTSLSAHAPFIVGSDSAKSYM